MTILTLDLKLPSEFAKTATVGTSADWLVIQKSGEAEVSKIAAVPAAVGAAPAGGALATNWSCGHLRTSTGYIYQQADGGSLVSSIAMLNTGVLDRMVFRNAAGFQFYGDLSGTTLGDVYAGVYSGTGYYLSGDLDTGIFSGGANILAFETGGTGCAYFSSNGHFLPGTGGTFTLGNSGNRWKEIWCTQSSINSSSDGRLKTDVADSDLGLDFIRSLHPVVYRAVSGDKEITPPPNSGGKARIASRPGVRPHYGLIAQEVKAAMGGRDFAGYLYDPDTDTHGLRYGEFIAPMVKAMQELHGQVKEERQARLALEQRLSALEQRLSALEMALGPIGAGKSKV